MKLLGITTLYLNCSSDFVCENLKKRLYPGHILSLNQLSNIKTGRNFKQSFLKCRARSHDIYLQTIRAAAMTFP
jgi:hypothetical protein